MKRSKEVAKAIESSGIAEEERARAFNDGVARAVVDQADSRYCQRFGINSADLAIPAVANQRHTSRSEIFELPESIDLLPKRDVRDFVERLAKAHGIQYQPSGIDVFAEDVTRLAGDDVGLDETGKLLATLRKSNVITGRQLARLMTNYMIELRDFKAD